MNRKYYIDHIKTTTQNRISKNDVIDNTPSLVIMTVRLILDLGTLLTLFRRIKK